MEESRTNAARQNLALIIQLAGVHSGIRPRKPRKAPSLDRHLKNIGQSDTFDGQEIPRRLLDAIVSATLAGQPHTEMTLGLSVWKKDSKTWRTADKSLVRNNVQRLRKLLDRYYAKEGDREYIRIRIPKGAYAAEIKFLEDSSLPVGADRNVYVPHYSDRIAIPNVDKPFLLSQNEKELFELSPWELLDLLLFFDELIARNPKCSGLLDHLRLRRGFKDFSTA